MLAYVGPANMCIVEQLSLKEVARSSHGAKSKSEFGFVSLGVACRSSVWVSTSKTKRERKENA